MEDAISPTLQYSNTPALQHSSTPILQSYHRDLKVAEKMRERLIRRMVEAGEAASMIEPAPEVTDSVHRRVFEHDILKCSFFLKKCLKFWRGDDKIKSTGDIRIIEQTVGYRTVKIKTIIGH